MSVIFKPVSGLISVTIFSKSSTMISRSSNLIIPVETPSSVVETAAPGLIMSLHETRCIPITESTWKAISSLLKFVMINKPPGCDVPLCRQFFKSIAVIIVSRGIKIPSMLGCAFGTGVTSS